MNLRTFFFIYFLLSKLLISNYLFAQHKPAEWEINLLKQLNKAGTNMMQDKFVWGASQSIYPLTAVLNIWPVVDGVLHKDLNKITQGATRTLATGIAFSSIFLLKNTFRRERPDPAIFSVPFHKTGFSFPSGHAAIASSLATMIILEKKPWYWCAISISGCLLISYTRNYLGVHYPGDVITGILVGSGSALLTLPLRKITQKCVSKTCKKLKIIPEVIPE